MELFPFSFGSTMRDGVWIQLRCLWQIEVKR